ncbi:MAG: GH32 C-terminal domain-containing protein [Streptococcaceae bacterium]|jgi:fructan beta-fructosidase|nr:GH32 C-terminal domain-containing protein [Streptococcaceae bacterium]MCH4177363.1 GH32 C-terminal domain-containing protein [Streptococcaceae bacterium]
MRKNIFIKRMKLMLLGMTSLLAIGLVTSKSASADSSANQNSWQYNELYRNQFHYSASQNWLNDPNGLLYDDSTGIYHMYYQYNPNGNSWGDMSWGHATSTDMINWQEQSVAIPMLENQDEMKFEFTATSGEFKGQTVRYWGQPRSDWDGANGKKYIFSGSTAIDKNNVTGLGANTILAYYTTCFQIPTRLADDGDNGLGTWVGIREVQEQHLAYSTDGGMTFKQYDYDSNKSVADNATANLNGTANQQSPKAIIPVTAISGKDGVDAKDFRDPKVVYDEENKQWLMIVVAGQQAQIFKSKDMINWEYASAIERQHDVGNGVWECPELIPMTADDGTKKWILTMSVQDGAYASGSGMQYFVGDIDATGTWTPATDQTLANPNWLDYGEDFYAGVTFGNTGDRKIMLAWESNWKWTGLQKTTPWYSNMTIPRELELVSDTSYDGGYKITQTAIAELDESNAETAITPALNKGDSSSDSGVVLDGSMRDSNAAKVTNYTGTNYKVESEFSWDSDATKPTALGIYVRGTDDFTRKVMVGYDLNAGLAYVNILTTGDADLSGNGRDNTNVSIPDTGKIKLTALVDESSVEVFINDGEKTITQVFYFRPEIIGADVKTNNVGFYVEGGNDKKATISNAKITPYRSIFGDIDITANDTPITYGGAIDLESLVAANNTSGTGEVSVISSVNIVKGLASNAIGTHEVVYSATNTSGKYQEKIVQIKVVADKTALKAKIDEANAILPNEVAYTDDSWSTFTSKLDAANISYDSTDVTQTQDAIDTATNDLTTAISGLVSKVDKTALNVLIDLVDKLANSASDYTESSWSNLAVPLSEAKSVKDKLDATESEVGTAYNNLFKAVRGLALKEEVQPETEVNKTALEVILELYSAIESHKDSYTTASWQKVVEAYTAAKTIFEDEATTQAKIDESAKNLSNSIKNLETTQEEVVPSISYSTHVQNVGWQNALSDGQKAGTTGKSLRLEAIKINLADGLDGGIEYMTHVQDIGNQKWVSNGALAGTTGKGLRLEALKIRLTGELETKYDVYYRVHVQNIGNQKWVKNGELAGTTGKSLRLEAVQVLLVKKGDPAPANNLPF